MRPHREVTDIGIRFAKAASDEAKEVASMELIEAFHPYLHKYLDMIVHGRVPVFNHKVNGDAKQLLVYLLPPGSEVNLTNLNHACRHLHWLSSSTLRRRSTTSW